MSKFVFLNESTLKQFLRKRQTVRRPVGMRFYDCYAKIAVKHPSSVTILGPVFSHGIAGLVFTIETTINGVRYRKMSEDKLEIHTAIRRCKIFMQDSAS